MIASHQRKLPALDKDVPRLNCVCWNMDSTCVQDAFLGRLSTERIRNHLDMRHRLDKDGKRYGKVINYKCESFVRRQLCTTLRSMH